MEEAGVERLYDALSAIVRPALAYKRRKPAETLLHHLDETVLAALRDPVTTALVQFKASLQLAVVRLDSQRVLIADAAWRLAVPSVLPILERYGAERDGQAICSELASSLLSAFLSAARDHLADYAFTRNETLAEIYLKEQRCFEDLAVDADDNWEAAVVDHSRLYAVLRQQIHTCLLRLSEAAIGQCLASLSKLLEDAERLEGILASYENRLLVLKSEIRLAG